MPSYNSSYTGIQIDDAIAKVITAHNDGGVVSSNMLTTTLGSYLLSSTAISTYEPKLTAGTSGQFYRGDKSWSNTLTDRLYLTTIAQASNDHTGQLSITSASTVSGASYFSTIASIAPNVGNSQHLFLIGTGRSGGNSAYFGFHYEGSSAAELNRATIGLFGQDQLINANYRGHITLGDVQTCSTAWGRGTTIVGNSSSNKAVIGYLASSTSGVVFGGHNSTLTGWAPVNLSGTSIYFRENETIRAKILDGCLSLYPVNSNYREGIRIHANSSAWCHVTFCGTDNTGDSGISANSYLCGVNAGNFYISKNNSTGGPASFQCVNNHWQLCNLSNSDYNYGGSCMWIREYNYSNAGSDTWGQAPRLGWHWAGRVAGQIGIASNGYLYEAPVTATNFYRIALEGGSSRTIKDNIHDLPDMGDKIDQLHPVSFTYIQPHPTEEEITENGDRIYLNPNTEDDIRYGLIHEDTVDILPDICKFDKWQYGGKTINYIDLIPVLIKEIQSLRKRVKELEAK